MVHDELVKVTIDVAILTEVIIDMVIQHEGLLELRVTDQDSPFIYKFWSPLCYFLGLKQ